jgi:uncharacterized radical SAM superfamily Fe-S cluster-containing enzyme
MIPDFKGHRFVEDFNYDGQPAWYHCERCGMNVMVRTDGAMDFHVSRIKRVVINRTFPQSHLIPLCSISPSKLSH